MVEHLSRQTWANGILPCVRSWTQYNRGRLQFVFGGDRMNTSGPRERKMGPHFCILKVAKLFILGDYLEGYGHVKLCSGVKQNLKTGRNRVRA